MYVEIHANPVPNPFFWDVFHTDGSLTQPHLVKSGILDKTYSGLFFTTYMQIPMDPLIIEETFYCEV